MWVYWAMFLLPASVALACRAPARTTEPSGARLAGSNSAWVWVWLSITLLIGFRYAVGGDWGSYVLLLDDIRGQELVDVLLRKDPGYKLLNWVSVELGWGIYGVNLTCGALFATGLVVFCRRQPMPWLALTVAVPYLMIVVAMGYSRQGVGVGLAMLGLVALSKGSVRGFVAWVLLAATFHGTAVILLPISALAASQNRFWTAVWVTVVAAVAYSVLLAKDVESLYANYVDAGLQSEGALVRLLMNAAPAAVLLILRSRFRFDESEKRLWMLFAMISLALLGAFYVTSASTALDRLALYMIPLQLAVFANVPYIFERSDKEQDVLNSDNYYLQQNFEISPIGSANAVFIIAIVLLYYGSIQFVWLNFGANSMWWLPYRFYPLEF
ncbi:MAG TPA: EpsG family protein [Methylosinus sp.]|jgi:hypothetical protein|uniref:EpsG family protein n=1 Tax=Methylosinus sp. TaxID=427 RepID=UPI002F95DD2C